MSWHGIRCVLNDYLLYCSVLRLTRSLATSASAYIQTLNLYSFATFPLFLFRLQYDTEIVYLENNLKGRDHVQTLEAITQDINKTDQLYRQINEEVSTNYFERHMLSQIIDIT